MATQSLINKSEANVRKAFLVSLIVFPILVSGADENKIRFSSCQPAVFMNTLSKFSSAGELSYGTN